MDWMDRLLEGVREGPVVRQVHIGIIDQVRGRWECP